MTAIPRAYSLNTCIGNWYEERYTDPKNVNMEDSKLRPAEDAIPVTRMRRLPPSSTKNVITSDNFSDYQSSYKRNFVHPTPVPPRTAPAMITTTTLAETFKERKVESRPETGFGSVLPRFDASQDQRHFETTCQAAFGRGNLSQSRGVSLNESAGVRTGSYTTKQVSGIFPLTAADLYQKPVRYHKTATISHPPQDRDLVAGTNTYFG
eukprot:TRINITY_DN2228_c0_g1_i2.p1 TRINITY_DN2228_c0_g1~~TRINITY_DN2228_c0_g1_i2.p1  ORF type:complete len:233 (-),score=9.95 TRINITY_DN2228_c0_g1_i2:19-642(-)